MAGAPPGSNGRSGSPSAGRTGLRWDLAQSGSYQVTVRLTGERGGCAARNGPTRQCKGTWPIKTRVRSASSSTPHDNRSPAGIGKSILASHWADTAAGRGERAAIYLFDEGIETFLHRSDGIGLALRDHMAARRVSLRQLDPAELSPGEFNHVLREAVEREAARVVIIDSLNGYLNAMAEERAVLVQLHELLSYLNQTGVMTLLTLALHGLLGSGTRAPIDVSYLADTVVLLRYFEAAGELRRAISVVKKRTGAHERSIRELRLSRPIVVGEPLREFSGVLTDAPAYIGAARRLLDQGGE